MNELMQLDTFLLGSPEAERGLENAERVCLLVVSDSHGNAEILEEILLAFGKECGALVFCGDGAADLMTVFEDSRKNSRLAAALPPLIAPARGNGDGEWYSNAKGVYEEHSSGENPVTLRVNFAHRIVFRAAGRTVFVTHGHYNGINTGFKTLVSTAEVMDADLVFFGHTHRPYMNESGTTLVLNPGSCSQPRGGFPPSFALVSFPGGTEHYSAHFYRIKKTLFGGVDFVRFTPSNSV